MRAENNADTNLLLQGVAKLPVVLNQLGYPSLRPGQDSVVYQLLSGRDTIAVLPTSQGKTACFIIPTLCHGWKTLVFSPLVALMRDQVKGLWNQGVRAAQMSGTQTETENNMAAKAWMMGELDVFYIAPERLHNQVFKDALSMRKPDMVVLDEGHVISGWSDNFRESYCLVGDVIPQVNPKVVGVFTATCPNEVEADIRRVVGIPNASKLTYYPRRTNLKLTSRDLVDDYDLVDAVREVNGSVLVYCATIKNVERIASLLAREFPDQVTFYHGSLDPASKRTNQDSFMTDTCPIVVATNAFGMGIDKPGIRGVIHYDIPGSIEAVAQETGRAGRDGKDSVCIMFYQQRSFDTQMFFLNSSYPSEKTVNTVFNTLKKHMDAHGICRLRQRDLAALSGVDTNSVDAAISILTGNKIVERFADPVKLSKIELVGVVDDEKFTNFRTALHKYGVVDVDGLFTVDLSLLPQSMGVQEPTIKTYIKKWERDGIVRYFPPYNGATTRLIQPDTSCVDFKRLRVKGVEAYGKLQKVVDYCKTPDESKHSFIEKCFDIEQDG
jgi:ATP-dependent DNA helicase RecQ